MPAAGKAYCHLEGDFGTSRFLAAVDEMYLTKA
jgi:hypothetical protein